MIDFSTELSFEKFDYKLDKPDRFTDLLPYLFKKIDGDWNIELVGMEIGYIRELLDYMKIPKYVHILVVVSDDVISNLQAERPDLIAKKKTMKEYYNDLIANLPVFIESRASSILYSRIEKDRILIKQTLDRLVSMCEEKGVITVSDVKSVTLNNKVYYSNQVIKAFAELDKNRWKIYSQFESSLGRRYAFYALRKYIKKLLKDKTAYLNNESYKDRNVTSVDTYTLIFLYDRFTRYKPDQLVCIFSELDSIRKGDEQDAVLQ